MKEHDAEHEAYLCTVRGFVEREAAKYQDDVIMDDDKNKALLQAMESAALVWSKQTYKKLDPATQQLVQPGLKMRLDRIDAAYPVELAKLTAEHAARMLQDLDTDGNAFATLPSSPSA